MDGTCAEISQNRSHGVRSFVIAYVLLLRSIMARPLRLKLAGALYHALE